MDTLSTELSTTCPLLKNGLCCQSSDPSQALSTLSHFIKEINYSGEFCFEKSCHVGFRRKVKLAIGGTIQTPLVGLYQQGSHKIVDMECCLIHHENIKNFISTLKGWIKTAHIEPYNEKTHQGILRYVQCLVNEGGKLQVVLVLNQEVDMDLLLPLTTCDQVDSLWVNHQKQRTNTIFSDQWTLIYGSEFLTCRVMGLDFCFHPGAFCQSNLSFFELLLKDIQKFLPHLSKGLDLYAGVGIFGLSFQNFFNQVHFVETNVWAELSFKQTLKSCHLPSLTYSCEDAKECLKKHVDAECVFVDPPRKGLHKEIKPLLAQLKKGAVVIYVSCGYESLIRDVKELYNQGFCLEFIKAYDCFPGSGEVEILCILRLTI